jgi:hypothetical protein
MNLFQFYHEFVERRLELFENNCLIIAGKNGPWNDEETEARVISHYIVLFGNYYQSTGDRKVLSIIEELGGRLISDVNWPMQAAFFHRKTPFRDFSNGLMGQAWTIEALLILSNLSKRSKQYIHILEKLIRSHQFSFNSCLWHILNVDGSVNAIDYTFNHQLWFGVMCKLSENYLNEKIDECDLFFENLNKTNVFDVSNQGLIRHPSFGNEGPKSTYYKFNYLFKRLKGNYKEKEIGYHLFNLYSLALLKNVMPNYELLLHRSAIEKIHRAQRLVFNEGFQRDLINNMYSYKYNSPAFEFPVIAQSLGKFDESIGLVEEMWKVMLEQCYNNSLQQFTGNGDEHTLTARFYEISYLSLENMKKIKLK